MEKKKKIVLGASVGILGVGAVAALVGVVVVGLVAAIFLLPVMLKGPVTSKINALIAENVDADVALGGVELSFLQTFPRLGVTIRGVEIKNHAPFDGVTLGKLPELTVELNLWSVLMGNTFEIQGITLVNPELSVVVGPDGAMNTSITKGKATPAAADPASVPSQSAFGLRLNDLSVSGASVRFDDQRDGGPHVALEGIDFELQGSFDGDVTHVATEGEIAKASAKTGGITWLSEAKTTLDATVDYTISTGAMTFDKSKLVVNAFPLGWKGSIVPQGEDYLLDLVFEAEETTFSALLSLVPSAFAAGLTGLSSQGTLGFSGNIKGRYGVDGTYPASAMTLTARDARFQYPDLPAVENIDIDIAINHPEGDLDQTVVDIKHIGFRTADAPFDGEMRIAHPMTDPDIDASLKGRIDVAALRAALPAQQDSIPASGRLDLDLDLAGRVSDFQAANVERVKASGNVRAADLRPPTEDWPKDMRLSALDLSFSPERVDVRDLQVRYGKSDLGATGRFDNLVGYALGVGVLSGSLDVVSKHLDLRPFQGDSEETPAQEPTEGSTSEDGVIAAVPKDIAFNVNGQFDHVVTELFSMDNAKGKVIVENQEARLEGMRADAFGGEVTVSGKYAATNTESADLDIDIDSYHLNIGKLMRTFGTLREIAPILTDAVGSLDAGISLVTRLKKDGSPVIEELSSSGLLGVAGVTLRPSGLQKSSAQLGEGYDTVNLDNSKLSYALEKGMFTLEPANIKLGSVAATLSGSAGVLAKTIDMRFDSKIPTKTLSGTPLLAAAKSTFGPKIDLILAIKGPWSNPKLSVSIDGLSSVGDVVEKVVEEVVGAEIDKLLAEAERQGDALVAAARTAAANLLATAQKSADAIEAEAKKEGNKLVKDAKNPIAEIAAKEAQKVINNEAGKAADKVISEAKKAGDKLINDAEAKKDALIAAAKSKSPGGSPSPSKAGKGKAN